MSKKHMAPSDGQPPVISIPAHSAKERYRQNLLLAEQSLSAYQQGDAEAADVPAEYADRIQYTSDEIYDIE